MLSSILIGATAGARSLTPLAAVSVAAARGKLPADNGAPPLLGHRLVAAATVALAAAELAGDKMKSAPDRIVVAGLVARLATGALAGMALAPRRRRYLGAALGAGAAVAASFPTFRARIRAMAHAGQTATGLVEDAVVAASAVSIVAAAAGREPAA